VLTRLHKPNIVKDLFTGQVRMQVVLQHFKKAGRGVLVYLRDGAAGVPVAPLGEPKTAEADRNRQWREVGVGAQILRDLGVTSIINLTSSVHDYKDCPASHRDRGQRTARYLEHDPEKHALGIDPMGGYRFSEKDHALEMSFRACACANPLASPRNEAIEE